MTVDPLWRRIARPGNAAVRLDREDCLDKLTYFEE